VKKWTTFLFIYVSFPLFNVYPQQPGWEVISLGTSTNFNSIHFIQPFDLYICGNALFNVSSTDSGATWQVDWEPTPVPFNDIFVIDQNTIVTVGNSGSILRTTDGGLNWAIITSGVTDDLLSVSFFDSFGICGARSQTLLYSSNSGVDWNIAQSGWVGGGFWGAIMLSPEIGFVAGENSIWQPLLGMTADFGQNWNFSAFYLNNNEGRATGINFTDMFIGFASARVWDGRGAISKTTNTGSDWVTTFFNNPLWDIDFPISATGLIGYAVGDSGAIYKTYDAGLNWLPQQSETSVRLNGVHFLDLDYGFAVGENGTLLRTTTGGEPVTGMANNSELPVDFKLEQNYPNPFNPMTKIKFTIPSVTLRQAQSDILVTLKVYDVLGNEVATLVNEELPSGEYEVEFNISNLSGGISVKGGSLPAGRHGASGVYFYQLKTEGYLETKKMLLIK
jgi:photosystem II stability/assembly factor-like uncharacterized protein